MKTIVTFFAIGLMNLLFCNNRFVKYRPQIKISKTLIERIKQNDVLSIKKMIGVELEDIGINYEILAFRVKKIQTLLDQYGIAKERKYKYVEYSKIDPLLVEVIIPILKSKKNEKKNPQIIVSFAKYIEEGKILDFDLKDPLADTIPVIPTVPVRNDYPPIHSVQQKEKKNE